MPISGSRIGEPNSDLPDISKYQLQQTIDGKRINYEPVAKRLAKRYTQRAPEADLKVSVKCVVFKWGQKFWPLVWTMSLAKKLGQ
jgi:hypothetical protein